MVVVTSRHLDKVTAEFGDAAKEVATWKRVVAAARWKNFEQVRASFPDADAVDGYVVFNVRHNRYRLITVMHYSRMVGDRRTQGHCYVRSVLTHGQFNEKSNWDEEFGR